MGSTPSMLSPPDHPRNPDALEHGARSALDPAVVPLDPVVQPAAAAMPGEAPQLAVPLHLPQRAGVALEPVRDHLARVAGVLPTERPAEEAARGRLVAPGAEQEV